MSEIRAGDKVAIHGFLCEVISTGVCEGEGCGKQTVTIIDPEGAEDTVHLEDLDAQASQ
jgi:hypothetical protein